MQADAVDSDSVTTIGSRDGSRTTAPVEGLKPPSRSVRASLLRIVQAGLVAVLLTAAASLFSSGWWVGELCISLLVQQVLALLFCCAAACVLRGTRTALLSGVAAVCLAPTLLPALTGSEDTASGPVAAAVGASDDGATGTERRLPGGVPVLRVTVLNVLTSNPDHDRILQELVRLRSDVFCLPELSPGLHRRIVSELGESYPHQVVRPDDHGNFGIGLYSRLPFVRHSGELQTDLEVPVMTADVRFDGTLVSLFGVHTLPPMSSQNFRIRNQQLEDLTERIRNSGIRQKAPVEHIALGDFNLTPWSPHFHEFEAGSGLRSAFRGRGLIPTWYSQPYFVTGLILDHVFVSERLSTIRYEVGPDVGSDHRSVTVDVCRKY